FVLDWRTTCSSRRENFRRATLRWWSVRAPLWIRLGVQWPHPRKPGSCCPSPPGSCWEPLDSANIHNCRIGCEYVKSAKRRVGQWLGNQESSRWKVQATMNIPPLHRRGGRYGQEKSPPLSGRSGSDALTATYRLESFATRATTTARARCTAVC